MLKGKNLLTIAILLTSIALSGCVSQKDEPQPEDPGTEEPVEEPKEEKIYFTSATITPGVLKVNSGETLQASASTLPENSNESGVVWVSQNEDVATVDQTGLITGLHSGTSKISIYGAESNRLLGSKMLTVIYVPQPEESIHIDIPDATEKTQLSVTYKDYIKKSVYGQMDYCPTSGNTK